MEKSMSDSSSSGGNKLGGIGLGGIITIIGIVWLIVGWPVGFGIILILIGLIAFGGFAKGKWY